MTIRKYMTALFGGLLIVAGLDTAQAQNIRWLRVADLQAPVSEIGAEWEAQFNIPNTSGNYLSWPVKFNIDQTVKRSGGLLIGCKNFNDPVEGKIKGVKVIGSGPKAVSDPTQILPLELKLVGREPHPKVYVDDNGGTVLDNYDVLDEVDPSLPCDRMVYIKFNTSMGITVTKKVMSFADSKNGNYFINDYVFTNTGIVNTNGDIVPQTLDSVWVYFLDRYAIAGVTSGGFSSTWGAFPSLWGQSMLNHAFGENPGATEFNDPSSPLYKLRGFYSYYGPWGASPRPNVYAEDWGCPKLDDPGSGTLGTAKYTGCATLHADVSPKNHADDPYQPRTTWFISADYPALSNTAPSQYDETFMADRWSIMTEGHPTQQHDELIGDTYPDNYRDPRRNLGGGVAMGQGFGPYNGLAPGDSIHIVFVEGVSGISWEKGREVGSNWLQWRNNTGSPQLVMPDGSTTTDYNQYKRRWCETGRDSILQTYRNAVQNFESGYAIPKPPPPPNQFKVTSGGDRIMLEWTNNAESAPHFDGYVIYRSRGLTLDWRAEYEKIFECSKSNAVNRFDDVTALRGFDYYYYIQSKDDGTQVPNQTLYSSLFWTVTSVPATLQRPAVAGPPAAPAVDTLNWRVRSQKGPWALHSAYAAFDEAEFGGTTYVAVAPITDSQMDPAADTTRSWKLLGAAKGAWLAGSAYSKYTTVTYNGTEYLCIHDIAAGSLLEQVRVVPNPYDIRSRVFQFGTQSQYDRIAFFGLPGVCKLKIFTERGDLIWSMDHTRGTGDELWDSKTSSGQIVTSGIYILYVETPDGKSIFRKFVIIR